MLSSSSASDDMNTPSPTMDSVIEDFPPVDSRSCQLLGPTALVVQGLMGVLVILSLVYKRHREEPRRPWRIWLFDVSKQVVGQMFVHAINLLVSNVGSTQTSGNACVFYFLNILIDTTLGVGMIYVMLHFYTYLVADKWGLKGFESGVYGNPPAFKYWIRQAAIYVLSLTTMKIFVLLLLMIPGILKFGEWLLSWTWTEEGDSIQVIFTIGIFPIIMNILQFWLIDSIVKASGGVGISLDSTHPHARYDPLDSEPLFEATYSDDDDNSQIHDIENQRKPSQADSTELKTLGEGQLGPNTLDTHSYPPSDTASPVSVASSSGSASGKKGRRSLPKPLNLGLIAHLALKSPMITANTPQSKPAPANDASSRASLKPQPTALQGSRERGNEWGDSWEGSDDWAERVGEEEWTGRRLEEMKSSINQTWQNSSTS